MSSPGRTVGSIETYEAEDKLFSKHIFQEGHGDSTPNEGSVCVVNINPIGEDGMLDINEKNLGGYQFKEDVEVVIGEGDCPLSELFDKVVVTMREGEQAYVRTKVDTDCKKVDDIAVNKSALKFNASLKSFSRAADLTDLEPDEKLERAEHHKERGTAIYQLNNIDFGLRRFQRALDYINSIQSTESFSAAMTSRMNTLKCHCNLNLAAGYLKKELFEKVVECCNVAVELEPKNVKGLFRRGQAYAQLSKYEEARQDLQQARGLDPQNKAVAVQLNKVEWSIKKEKDMYKKMFSH